MKVVLTTAGRFHSFDMARQLDQRGVLEAIFTGYPLFKLKSEAALAPKIRSFPWIQTPNMFLGRVPLPTSMRHGLSWLASEALDRYVSKRIPPCDVFVGLSGSGLRTGRVVKKRDGLFVCDRGSSHIAVQDELVAREYQFYGLKPIYIDPRTVRKEEEEYALADAIFTPSSFAKRTFIERGVPESKLAYAPYGVDLSNFRPSAEPDPERFDVLYVGAVHVRKGIRFLVSAFKNLDHPGKRLTLVGTVSNDIMPWLEREIRDQPIQLVGHLSRDAVRDQMSRSHVMVLPSVEDGFGLVISQAMACGCPVIASDHSGGPDAIDDDVEGYVFPSGDIEALTHYLSRIAKDPAIRARLSLAGLARVARAGGWEDYGERVFGHLNRLTHN